MLDNRGMKFAALLSSAAVLMMHAAILPVQAEGTPDFSYLGAVGNLTEAQTQAVAEAVYASLAGHQATVELSREPDTFVQPDDASLEALHDIFATVAASTDAGILAVKNSISFQVGVSRSVGACVKSVTIYYQVDDASYDAAYADAIAKVDAISAQVQDDWSDVEKALFFHDYLAVHYEYDNEYDSYSSDMDTVLCHTAYGLLSRGVAVCEGYAWLYNLLLAREGIEGYIVSSEQIEHAWNLVRLPEGWAHVDVTWDDCYQGFAGRMLHDNFLAGSEKMVSTNHTSNDWTISTGQSVYDMDVTVNYEDGFWSGACGNITRYNGQWLVMDQDTENYDTGWFDLYTYDAASNTAAAQPILSLTQYWTQPGSDSLYWPGVYEITAAAGDVIYYTTPTAIHAIVNGQPTAVFDLNAETQQTSRIYGMYIDGDTMYFDLAADPNSTPERYYIALSDYPVTPEVPTTEAPTEPETEAPTETEPTTEASTEPATDPTTETATDITTEPTTEAPTDPETVQGDLDGDGEISVTDVIVLTRHLLCTSPMEPEAAAFADVTGDGEVDVFDLAMLKRMLLNQ